MQGVVTWEMVAFAVAMLSAVAGVWWRIETRIDKAKDEAVKTAEKVRDDTDIKVQAAHAQASMAISQLAEYKVHAAETYVSRDSVREMKDEIMGAFRDMKGTVDHMNSRLDRVIEAPPKRAASTR